ncbi:MAG TPA: L,D-transpeptidase [Patescibacteria group bacterium]|nr:L,D-transpeptidase [Patescibacteria group bacterium]
MDLIVSLIMKLPAKYLFLLLIPLLAIFYLSKPAPANSFCANSVSCIKNLNVNVENNAIGTFDGQKIIPPKIDLSTDKKVLGDETGVGEKHIYVDLTTQTLYAYQGNNLFMQAVISSGKWHPTPTGDFTIWEKVRATRMTGGEGADYYDLPNVPFTMFFAGGDVPEGDGFALHGAYWHDNFGHPMSHGCINMRTVDAEKLYNWVEDPSVSKTLVTIYGQANI